MEGVYMFATCVGNNGCPNPKSSHLTLFNLQLYIDSHVSDTRPPKLRLPYHSIHALEL
jgi:hypothetical protein